MTSERQDARPFRIVISVEDGRQVITPEGELDLLTVAQLDRRLIQAMPEGDTVIDLSKVSFIDSSGIALLVSASATARQHEWRLELRDPFSVRRPPDQPDSRRRAAWLPEAVASLDRSAHSPAASVPGA
jgi:anti-anti-sigma factor